MSQTVILQHQRPANLAAQAFNRKKRTNVNLLLFLEEGLYSMSDPYCSLSKKYFISQRKGFYIFKCPAAAAAAKSLQSCPTLCDPIDGSPPGSPIPGILQARTLDCVAISFSSAWKWKVKVKSLSRVRLLATPWTAAYHAYFLAKLNSVLCPVLQLHFVITVCLCGSLIPITLNIQRWPSNLTLLICLFPRK